MTMSKSASMYNSPYTYKPPPPKIKYPSLFSGCTDISCRYALDSWWLVLCVCVLAVADVVVVGMLIAPFWFDLVFDKIDGTYGSQPIINSLTIESGLFFLKESEFDNWIFTDTFTGRDAVPKQIQAAQFFAVFGSCILVPCLAGGIMLMMRQLASPTGLFILAGAVSLGAFSEVLVVIFCGAAMGLSSCDPSGQGVSPSPTDSGCNYNGNLVWRLMPIYSQMYRVEPHVTPHMKPNWAFYIAIIGAGLTIAAAVCFWIEACLTGKRLGQIRYRQLREARDPFEHDYDPYMGKKYKYQPPSQQAPGTYGMQPVVMGIRYDGSLAVPPSHGYVPPASFAHEPSSPSYEYERKLGPPSTISSASGPIISREIDL